MYMREDTLLQRTKNTHTVLWYLYLCTSGDQGPIVPNTIGNNIKTSICCTVYGCLITFDMFQIILAHYLCMPYIDHSILDYLMTETPTSKHKQVCIMLDSESCM